MYEIYQACNSCLNRKVSVHTVYGQRHKGVIVRVDEQNVYLDTSGTASYGGATISNTKTKKAKTSAFGFGRGFGFGREREFGFGREREREFGGRGSILTLALFDLLAIALIL